MCVPFSFNLYAVIRICVLLNGSVTKVPVLYSIRRRGSHLKIFNENLILTTLWTSNSTPPLTVSLALTRTR
jgi:hypothetical protein